MSKSETPDTKFESTPSGFKKPSSSASVPTGGMSISSGSKWQKYEWIEKENAVAFCEMMKAEMGWDTYGNPNYVDRLMLFYLKFLQEGEGEYFPDTGTTQFLWPLPGYDTQYITVWYGQGGHNGLDIGAPEGTPIVAAEAGIVEEAYFHDSWGNNVYIKHNSQYGTRYAHMVRWAVSVGQEVKRGQVVGYVGDTGYSFGNHLHFEVYKDGTRIDPYPFIS